MKRVYVSVASLAALFICVAAFSTSGHAQTQARDKYVISAKAGGVNFISGNVTVTREGKSMPQALTDIDSIESGDVVTTGPGGRLEVLLNPGSYLRVAENSEFEMTNTSLDNLRIRLLRGSVVIEAVGLDDKMMMLEVRTPQTNAVIVKQGVYRINVLRGGETEVLVRKGRAFVGSPSQVVKGGQKIVIGRGRMETAKLDKKAQDSLDFWSRERAEYLASLNRRLQRTTLNASLEDFTYNWPDNSYNRRHQGVWVYDAANRCYAFVRLSGGGWSSPYGYDYPGGPRCNRCGNNPGNGPPNNGGTVAGPGNSPTPGNPPSGGEPSSRGPVDRGPVDSGRPSGGEVGRGSDGPAMVSRPDPPSYSPPPSAPSAPSSSPGPIQEAPRNSSAPQ